MYEIFENKLFLKEIMNMCLLVISEILGQFIYITLSADDKYSHLNKENLCNYLENKKANLSFSFAPSNFL